VFFQNKPLAKEAGLAAKEAKGEGMGVFVIRLLISLICFGFAAMNGSYFFTMNDLAHDFSRIVVAGLATVLLASGGVFVFRLVILDVRHYYRFREAFGFAASWGEAEWKFQKVHEKLVDRELTNLAYGLDSAMKSENNLLENPPKDLVELAKFRKKLKVYSRSIGRAKNRFWVAHSAAYHAGFSVKNSYKNYL